MQYKINPGDTLSQIAQTNKTDIASIQKLNPFITDPNKIQAGATINLPDAPISSAPSTQATQSGLPYNPQQIQSTINDIKSRANSIATTISAQSGTPNVIQPDPSIGKDKENFNNILGAVSTGQVRTPSPNDQLKSLIGSLGAPPQIQKSEPINVGTLQAEAGVPNAQNDLTTAQSDLKAFENTLLTEQGRIKGQAIETAIINGQLVKLDNDTAESYRQRQNAVSAASNRLNAANQTLGLLMDAAKFNASENRQNYQDVEKRYNDNFSNALKIITLQNSSDDKDTDNARAAVEATIKSAKDAPQAFALLTPEQSSRYDTLDLQAGFPMGYTTGILSAMAKNPTLEYKSSFQGSDGSQYAIVLKNGIPTTLKLLSGSPMSGGLDLTPKQTSVAIQLSNSLKSHPAYTDMIDIYGGIQGVETGLSQENGFGDITAINAFQRMVDPGATVRSEDVVLLQTASALAHKILSDYPIEKLSKGSKLPDPVRNQMLNTAKDLYETRAKNYNEMVGQQYKNLAGGSGVPFEYIGVDFPSQVGNVNQVSPEQATSILDNIVSGKETIGSTSGFWDDLLGVFGLQSK